MPATVWKGYLSFGLVSFPIRLFSAARPDTVHFHLLHKKDLSRVREVMYCAAEDKPLDRDEIVKGYEYEKNEYIVIDPDDLAKMAPPTASVMEILQFVRMDEIDPIFFETSYYVAPEEAVSKPYSLLLEAMKQTHYDALAKVAMHGREHIVILRPREQGIMLHTMYFVDELHKANEVEIPKPAKVEKKEIDMAKKLIETLAERFKPEEFHDEYKKNVMTLIEKKRKGQKIVPIKQPKTAPVIDLMQALQQSLARSGAKPQSKAAQATKSKASASKSARRKKPATAVA
ncbi:MAG: Ku protein [Acidobacteriaceae bacterium]|nr:Ku protein [Acidobacteriaceae bacterium]